MRILSSWHSAAEAWDAQTWAEVGSAAGSLLTAVIAIVAAIIALLQVREAKRLREEQAAPYVVAFLEPPPVASHALVDLVIKNFGNTVAHNVVVRSKSRIERGSDDGSTEEVVLPNKLASMAPGQEWRTFFDDGRTRSKSLPKSYEVVVEYESGVGSQRRFRMFRRAKRRAVKHSYTFTLDWAALEPRMFVVTYGVHDIAKTLRSLEQTGKKLASRVQTLTSGRKPLAVVVRDKDELARCDAERTEKRSELIARLQGSGPEKAQDARPEGEEDGVNGVGDESDEARCKGQLQPKLQP